jgi:hypothetical protein
MLNIHLKFNVVDTQEQLGKLRAHTFLPMKKHKY